MPSPASPDRPLPSSDLSTFEWNTIIRCAPPLRALSVYAHSMLPSGARPNKFTFTFLLKACLRAPSFSPLIHAHLAKLGLHPDPFLRSALIAAYAAAGRLPAALRVFRLFPHPDLVLRTALVSAFARCGLPDAALQAFDEIPHPNLVSWAALLSAYTRSDRHAEALSFFRRMRLAGVAPTEAALVSALSSAAVLGALVDGEGAHRDIVLFGKNLTPGLGTALFAMYAKCGRIDSARRLFDEMPHRDQPAWAAMITALASHGRGEEALRLFDEMLGRGLIPDHVTYVGVLHACSHAGLVDEARGHFDKMVKVYEIEPRAEHYGCMVDVLGRAGLVGEAWVVARGMPVAPEERVLKSLLSASCALGFVECAEWATERLVALDAGHASAYVLLSNVYAGLGSWEDSARVRKLMRFRGVPKAPGCSAVD